MDKKGLKKRLKIFLTLLSVAFIILVIRLFYLQVVMASQWEMVSEKNTLRTLYIPARRGDIVTSDGKVLATSKPVFTVSIMAGIPERELSQVAGKLAVILNDKEITAESIVRTVQNHSRKFEPVEIKRLVPGEPGTWEIITRIEEHRRDLPGVVIKEEPMRYYPEQTLAGHLLGYIGQINKEELEARKEDNYGFNDKIGKTGLERVFELINVGGERVGLRGKRGLYQVEVDAKNRIVKDLGIIIPPTPGYNLELTIDFDLQKAMEQAMDEVIQGLDNPKAKAAGAVVLDVNTGAILALASRPVINPNDFVDGTINEKKDYYFGSERESPLFNRAVQGRYPPGSTFKPITAMAALASGKVDPKDTVYCSGAYWRPPYIKCWDAHGIVDFYRAMAVSCNTYFQDVAHKAGIDQLIRVAKEFGLGQPLDVLGITGETKGLLPTPQWKKELNSIIINREFEKKKKDLEQKYASKLAEAKTFEEREKILEEKERELKLLETEKRIKYNFNTKWQNFDTYNTAIGQGSNSYTMLELANYTATLANGGKRWRPYLVKNIRDSEGNVIKSNEPELLNRVSVSQEVMEKTRQAMLRVTRPGGTAYSLFRDFPKEITVGAKTGTAQTGREGDDSDKDFHGVFIAFAPADNPQVAFAGIVEYGEHGSTSAGKIARAVFREYFGLIEGQDANSR
ncbi:MAG: penicillin-binding protein 2 [Thermoanaerobacteraceae bacterium]|nr:penicillin-binding protein 2 [Thermoanaerobacteraceae bacterium]